MPHRAGWWDYVQRYADGAPNKDIAENVGLHPSRLTGWQKGERVSPEMAAKFARSYKRPVIEALVAAGHLEPDESNAQVIYVGVTLREWSDDALGREVTQRMAKYRGALGLKDSPYELQGTPGGYHPGYRGNATDRDLGGEEPGVGRG